MEDWRQHERCDGRHHAQYDKQGSRQYPEPVDLQNIPLPLPDTNLTNGLAGLNFSGGRPYIWCMPSKRVPTPKETIQIRRLPKPGEKILVELEVKRTGRNTHDTADTVTVEIPGFAGVKVTATWDYLATKVRD